MNDLDINVELRGGKGQMTLNVRVRQTGCKELQNTKQFFPDHLECNFDQIWRSIGESIKEFQGYE